MPATERYQLDVFAIIVLIASILVLIFLIVAAIYFNGIQSWTVVPGSGESIFLFWSAIVLGVIFLAIVIYSFYRIFTHRAVICPKVPRKRVTTVTTTTGPEVAPTIKVANPVKPVEVTKPIEAVPPKPAVPASMVTGYPSSMETVSTAGYPSSVAKVVSAGYPSATRSTSVPASAQTSLQNELLNLSSALSE